MGYELKVIIGELSRLQKEELSYMSVISIYDLCVVPPIADLKAVLKSKGGKILERQGSLEMLPIYFYDGDKKKTRDEYDDVIFAFDPNLLLGALKDAEAIDHYRRYPPLIALLESLLANFETPFHVALYGH